jgi:hypothetical protein
MGRPAKKKPPVQEAGSPFENLLARLPLLWISLAFLAGTLLADRLAWRLTAWLVLAGAAAILAAAARLLLPRLGWRLFNLDYSITFLIGLCLVSLLLGAARYQAAQPHVDAHYVSWYNDR